jgi:hypothetical protein
MTLTDFTHGLREVYTRTTGLYTRTTGLYTRTTGGLHADYGNAKRMKRIKRNKREVRRSAARAVGRGAA